MTLFSVYVRTGDVVWLRRAHRSAAFYRAQLTEQGYFSLRGRDDLKYSYGQSLLTDYQLFGDAENIDAIRRVANAGEAWNPDYTLGRSFWTERHQAYALLAALSAWEATGEETHRARVEAILDATIDIQTNPRSDWADVGCMQHTGDAAAEGGSDPVCSPWMSALLADAMWHAHLLTEDPRVLTSLFRLATAVAERAVYRSEEFNEGASAVPAYLLRESLADDPWTDREHACDVAGLLARGARAADLLGRSSTDLADARDALVETCRSTLASWHRPSGPDSGLSAWRLAPPRKFNWWFGTTTDLAVLASP